MDKLLFKFDNFLKFLFHQSIRFHKSVIVSTILIFTFFGYQCLNLKQISSIEDQLDPKMQSSIDLKIEVEHFGPSNSIGFFIPKSVHQFKSEKFCKLQLDFNNLVYQHNLIEKANSPFKIRQAYSQNNQLNYLRVLENPCERNQFSLNSFQNSFYQGIFVSTELDDLFYSFSLKPMESPGSYMYFNYDYVKKMKASFESVLSNKILWFGSEIQQLFTIEGMAHSQWINLALVVVIWIALRFYFGTYLAGGIFIATLLFTNTIIYGGMSLLHQPVDTLSVCLFLMIAVSSLADFIFVAKHQHDYHCSFVESHLALITPSFFTSLTTILGFGSLMISNLTSISRFGFWALMGSFIEWIAVFLIIPSFMQVFPKLQLWVNPKKSIKLNFLENLFKKSPPKIISKISLVVFLLAILSMKHFNLSQTPTDMFPKNHPFQEMIEYVQKNRGWVGEVRVMFTPELSIEKRNSILSNLAMNPIVKKIESKQMALEFISQKITDPKIIDLIQTEFNISSMKDRYLSDSKYERAFLYLTTSNTQKINELRSTINSFCPKRECFLVGQYVGFADYSFQLIKTLFDSLFLSLALVMAIIYFLVRALKIKNFFYLIISSFWGPAVMLCLIYAFDLSINFVTCIVASTLVGLTGDNAIQFIFATKNLNLDEGINERATPAFYCSLTMAICSLLFLFSYFEPPRTLGILLSLGFLFSFVGDVWILKGLKNSTEKIK